MIDSADILGFSGVIVMVYSYIRVQLRRDYVKTLSYSLGNLVGSTFLAISLCYNWNLPSLISNVIWGIVSAYGVFRCLKYMRKPNAVVANRATE
jgi:hypothetical protein